MLNLVAAIGGGLFVLASLLVGGRLLWAGIRQRSLTEFAWGAASSSPAAWATPC